jgi:hypothetical protein
MLYGIIYMNINALVNSMIPESWSIDPWLARLDSKTGKLSTQHDSGAGGGRADGPHMNSLGYRVEKL